MPRPKHHDAPVEKKLSLPSSLVTEVEFLLHDPVRGKVKYGAFRDLVARLLKDWVRTRKLHGTTPGILVVTADDERLGDG